MNFVPYAIGFPKELLKNRGVVRVNYNGSPAWDSLTSADLWENEQEWRMKGNLFIDDELWNRSILITYQNRELGCYNHHHPIEFEG